MKKLIYLISLMTLGIFLMFLYGGCESATDPATTVVTTVATTVATTTTVSTTATANGTGSLPAGVSGAIGNTRVALYNTFDEWNFDQPFKFTACDIAGVYTIADVVPGNYYIDAWKDNDNNGIWGTSGDYVWVNGSGAYPNYTLARRSFAAGAPTITNFEIFLVP